MDQCDPSCHTCPSLHNLPGCYSVSHTPRDKAPATLSQLRNCNINSTLQTSQRSQCTCPYASDVQCCNSRYTQNLPSVVHEQTIYVPHYDQSDHCLTDCQRCQASCASEILATHQVDYDLHDVHGIQVHHQSRLASYETSRTNSNFPNPSWLSLRMESEGGSSPTGTSPRQSTDPGDLMNSGQTLSSYCRPLVPAPPNLGTLTTVEELRSVLPAGDVDELIQLQELYRDTLSTLPLAEDATVNRVEQLWQLYGLFVERQSLFYTKLPWFRLLAASDCPGLLRQAVAISTHITAAQYMDNQEYVWPRKDAPFVTTQSKVLSASTIRQIVSHEHFVLLMTFYTRYAHLLADPNVALFTQVLSLFSEEPGSLADAPAVQSGREHYLGLVTRYLRVVHGWQRGSDVLHVLLTSQEEAKKLSDIHQHVQLSPQVQRRNLLDVTHTLADNFHKICFLARYTIAKVIKRRQSSEVDTVSDRNPSLDGSTTTEQLNLFKNLLTRLAECEDPDILAKARHLLPPDLWRRFLQLLQ